MRNMTETRDLHLARLSAADASGGVSHDVIYKAALRNFSNPSPRRILDFGAGVGQFTTALAAVFPEAEVTGADIMERPDSLAANIHWIAADLNGDIPIEDGSFDTIFSLEVIEHLENPRKYFRELYRILSPQGRAIITTPNIRSLRSLVSFALKGCFAYFDDTNYPAHITPVSPLDMTRAASEAGFVENKVFFTDFGKMPKFVHNNWQDLPVIGRSFSGVYFSDSFGMEFCKPK